MNEGIHDKNQFGDKNHRLVLTRNLPCYLDLIKLCPNWFTGAL